MPDQILEDDAMIEDAVFVLTPDQPAAQAFLDYLMSTEIHGIIERKRLPTSSIW